MSEIRVSFKDEVKSLIKNRAFELGISCQEYIRILVSLDLYIQRYIALTNAVKSASTKINEYLQLLGFYSEISIGAKCIENE